MDLKEYEEFVIGLMSPASMKSAETRMAVAGLGLGGEGGECADMAKKVLFHGMEFDEENRQKLIKELGDVMFYVTFAAREVCGVSLEDVINQNMDKLRSRYKEGKFSVEEFLQKERGKG